MKRREHYSITDLPLKGVCGGLLLLAASEILILFLLPYLYPSFVRQSAIINFILLLLVNLPAIVFLIYRASRQRNPALKDSLSSDVIEMCEEALRETETRFRSLFNESRDAIYIRTKEGKFLDFNSSMSDLFGYSREEMLDMNVSDMYANESDQERFLELIEKTGFVKNFEVKLRRKDGREIDCLVAVSALRDKEGNISGYHGIIHDITERKKLEQQLMQAQKMEAVGRLAGGIAHDFNNILTAIIGYAHLLKLELNKDDPLLSYAGEIISSSERAANLTRALLTFSRRQVMSPKPLNINDVVQGMKSLLTRLIGEDVDLSIRLTEEDLTVMADITQMEQVLMNLVTNSRDAMPRGGSVVISTQRIRLDDDFVSMHGFGKAADFAMISVEDTGEGIDESIKDSIFDPFFSTKEVGKGTGLGLAIVYGIIKQHSGHVNVYSHVGKGTTFKIYLPLIETKTDAQESPSLANVRGGSETILIAEDNSQVRALTKKILANAGYQVIEAVDGAEAITLFKERRDTVQLLILDAIMPKMNGGECIREIRRIDPLVRAIFMSGYTADIMQKTGIDTEDIDLILKPVSPHELLRKVREVLDRPVSANS
ncbi:MAG TPA: PAS domain S-box protein [Thermodesulfovibrionales bacterium]|nr:PAS domain S-box protein [Thermodesulfovibrionales bacterium]